MLWIKSASLVFLLELAITVGLSCYECGGTTGRTCSSSVDASEIVKTEKAVGCNTTAYSCMTSDRDGVIEQRTCWSAKEQSCSDPVITGQPRVCTCTSDFCNCFGEAGSQVLEKMCPTTTDPAEHHQPLKGRAESLATGDGRRVAAMTCAIALLDIMFGIFYTEC